VLIHRHLIAFFEKFFYQDLDSFDPVTVPVRRNRSNEVLLTTYEFKHPGVLRQINAHEFAKSDSMDVKILKTKLVKLTNFYSKRNKRYSVDLEEMMRKRDNKTKHETQSVVNEDISRTNFTKIGKFYNLILDEEVKEDYEHSES
jgi:hypothetical protein